MKKLIISSLLILCFISVSSAQTYKTTPGCILCRTPGYVSDMIEISKAKDRASYEAYQTQGKCYVDDGGTKLTLIREFEYDGMLFQEVMYKGYKFYTVYGFLVPSND